ncbi:MAG TPA: glycosyltransferase, partial [Candidatus Nanopelagicales bacterium]|nr:glycosyltransferase [Candidatus Nanopelagicales bacterium]
MRIVLVSVEDDQRGPSVRAAFRRPAGDLADDLAAAGHEVRELGLFLSDRFGPRGPGVRANSLQAASLGLTRALESGDHDVLHVIGERAGRLVERIVQDAPWIWSFDEADAESRETGTVWSPRSASLVLVPNTAMADEMSRAGVARSRIRVVPERLSAHIA